MGHTTSSTNAIFVAVFCCLTVVTFGGRQRRDDAAKVSVTTIEDPPFVIVRTGSSSDSSRFDGFIRDLMDKIAAKADFQYDMRLVADSKYGGVDDKGRWNGMIGEVIDRSVDLAAAPLTISDKRKTAVDFTEPFMKFGLVVLMKKGTNSNIKSLKDLADQSDIKYGAVRHGVTENFFKLSSDPSYSKIHQEMTDNPENMMSKIKDGVDKVRSSDGKYAFIMESGYAEYWTNQKPCNDLEMVGKTPDTNEYALITRMNDPRKAKINKAIQSLEKEGEIAKLKHKWWVEESECGGSGGGAMVVTLPLVLSLTIGFIVHWIGRLY